MIRRPPRSTLFPTRRSSDLDDDEFVQAVIEILAESARSNLAVHRDVGRRDDPHIDRKRSEEHTSELQSLAYLVCRLLLEKKKKKVILTDDCLSAIDEQRG